MRKLKNMTITLEPRVAEWIRIEAAKRDTSVSRLVGEFVKERMQQDDRYWQAYRECMASEPFVLLEGTRLPKREEIYDRPVLRR